MKLKNLLFFIAATAAALALHTPDALAEAETVSSSKFAAIGNTDPDHRAPSNKRGEVVVTFDTMPTKMSFDLPGHIKMITGNNISYTNGATEAYIPAEGYHEGASYESWNDKSNKYSRMWIESQSPARIVVRHRCALVNGDKIIHQEKKKVAPYGPGNWVDEWYVIHPDGSHIRHVKIWNAVAKQSGYHGAKYPYEMEGMYLWPGHAPGKRAEDHLEEHVITLVKMDGSSKRIDFTPYPLPFQSPPERILQAYGNFANANIHVVNTKSTYHPFRIGRPAEKVRNGGYGGWNLMMSPYKPVHKLTQLVPCFPANATRESGYSVAGLGQMIYSDFWRITDHSMSEIWLNGFTNTASPAKELAMLAKSWWQAPKMTAVAGTRARILGHDIAERAYLVDNSNSRRAGVLKLRISAKADSPLVSPMILIQGWQGKDATVTVDGKAVKARIGTHASLPLAERGVWKDVLVVWLPIRSSRPATITIAPAGTGATAPAESATAPASKQFRTWTDVKGRSLTARLISYNASSVILQKQNGARIQIKRSLLSKESNANVASAE